MQLLGLIVPFVLLSPLGAPPGFLEAAVLHEGRLRVATALLLANGAVTCGIAVALLPMLRARVPRLAVALVVAGALMAALQAVDNAHIMGMVSLSREYARTSGSPADLFQVTGAAVRATRTAVHFGVLLAVEAWMVLFYLAIWRAAWVPRWLAVFGVLTAALHAVGVTVPWLAGYPGIMPLAMPLAAGHVAVAAWLLTRGARLPSVGGAPAAVP